MIATGDEGLFLCLKKNAGATFNHLGPFSNASFPAYLTNNCQKRTGKEIPCWTYATAILFAGLTSKDGRRHFHRPGLPVLLWRGRYV